MAPTRLDAVSRYFAQRRLSRRQALTEGGAGLAAVGLAAAGVSSAAAQDATPEMAEADAEHGPEMLFVQSFQAGSIAPNEGEDGRYTVTLEHELGQTIFFSDRPDRIVGASPTAQFLEGLGFPADNPPNAALVVETAAGETEIAVVELFTPIYDPSGPTVTYEAAVLANWEASTELGFNEAPADLATIAPSFGAAHLFIDGCSSHDIVCRQLGDDRVLGIIPSSEYGGFCWSDSDRTCLPCNPWLSGAFDAVIHWSGICQIRFAECKDDCRAYGVF